MVFEYAPTVTIRSCTGACTEERLCAVGTGGVAQRFARVALRTPLGRSRAWDAVLVAARPSGRYPGCLLPSLFTITDGASLVVIDAELLARNGTGAQMAAHELGHSLGMAHSHSAALTAPGEQPTYIFEYGDSWSIMGAAFAAPPAPMQSALGWLEGRAVARGGTYPLASLATGDALVWDRGLGSRLWIERRTDGPGPGVMLHAETGVQPGYAQSWLITPLPLQPGQTWTDPFTGASLDIGAESVTLR